MFIRSLALLLRALLERGLQRRPRPRRGAWLLLRLTCRRALALQLRAVLLHRSLARRRRRLVVIPNVAQLVLPPATVELLRLEAVRQRGRAAATALEMRLRRVVHGDGWLRR